MIASETGSGRVYVYTVRELIVTVLSFSLSSYSQRLQSLSLNIAPDHTTTMVSTFYRATYLIQYCQQRGFLYVFAFSNRENEFKYYNTVAL